MFQDRDKGVWTCAGFEPPLPIANATAQSVTETLWTFLTRAVADGALLLSVWLDIFLLRHRCLLMDCQYSQAAMQVCILCLRVNGATYVLCEEEGRRHVMGRRRRALKRRC